MFYRVRNSAGVYRWHLSRAVPVLDPEGRISQWVGALLDVHEGKTAEFELRLSEQRLRLAQVAARIQVFECVLRGEHPPAFEQIAVCADTICGYLGRVHPEDEPAVRAELLRALAGDAGRISLRYRTLANEQVGWYICEATRVTLAGNPPISAKIRMDS